MPSIRKPISAETAQASVAILPDDAVDITKLKYVLYARKSTTDETRQVRSIPDQIKDCQKMAADLGLRVVKILKETKSAKKPSQRPVFRQMINDIKRGVYHGILSWHPDRLSRNMLEGGEIIDLIDQNVIKDLKFKTHFFTRDANGLMLLGMNFVLSKQYSDDLSQKVTRGVRSRFEEGKSAAPKHGYVNEAGIYRPDGKNFELICEAWQMRLQGESLEKISSHMDKNSYGRIIKKDGRLIRMTPKILTDVFHDSFYYGVLVQAKQQVDLRLMPGYNFQPAVTEDEYNQVQLLSRRRLTPYNTRRRYTFYPLRALVRCAFCQHNMVVGPSTSHTGKRLLYYRCDNRQCGRGKRNIRSKVILDFLYDFFATKFKLTENDYKRYYERLDKLSDKRRTELKTQINSLQGTVKALDSDIKSRSLKIVDQNPQGRIKEINETKIAEQLAEKEELDEKVKNLKAKLTDPEMDRLSLEQFLNLSKNAARKVKSGSAIQKDAIVRIIFLNLDVDEEKVLSYQLKPAFAAMLKLHQSTSSRSGGSRTLYLCFPKAA